MKLTFWVCLLGISITSCQIGIRQPGFTIALSQPTMEDMWRKTMVEEMKRELIFYPGVKLVVTNARNDSQVQINQIDSLIKSGIDLLLVSPNEAATLSGRISEVYQAGIPVILIDRMINSSDYTTYIGSDNQEIGQIAALYTANKLTGKSKVLEVMGLPGSSPAIERHNGFQKEIALHPDIQLVKTVESNWQYGFTRKLFSDLFIDFTGIDAVYCHNDEMALAVSDHLRQMNQPKNFLLLGIDALPGPRGGIQMVLDGLIDATFIYPTGGEEAITTAMKVLQGSTVPREIRLSTSMVDKENARMLKFQGDKLIKQQSSINQQGEILAARNRTLKNQRLVGVLLLLLVMMLMVLSGVVLIQLRTKKRINHLLQRQNEEITEQKRLLEDLDSENQEAGNEIHKDPSDGRSPIDQLAIRKNRLKEGSRIHELQLLESLDDFITKNLSNPSLNIDLISEHMKLSRVQLYRKLKGLTGISVVDYVQHIRLAHAKELISESGLSLSEIAAKCGFNSASYFSTNFKNQFGMSPLQWKKSRGQDR
jgi:ABC-type sugar transport system substrate-binding protein/AraC-like DNA-binding protein